MAIFNSKLLNYQRVSIGRIVIAAVLCKPRYRLPFLPSTSEVCWGGSGHSHCATRSEQDLTKDRTPKKIETTPTAYIGFHMIFSICLMLFDVFGGCCNHYIIICLSSIHAFIVTNGDYRQVLINIVEFVDCGYSLISWCPMEIQSRNWQFNRYSYTILAVVLFYCLTINVHYDAWLREDHVWWTVVS